MIIIQNSDHDHDHHLWKTITMMMIKTDSFATLPVTRGRIRTGVAATLPTPTSPLFL